MALIARPAKQAGFLTYAAKVLGGFPKILDTEFDADFDTIYADHNGNIGASNLVDNAITTAKLNNDAVTAAKLASDAVTTAKLLNAAVTTPKLAQNASTPAFALSNVTAGLTITTEQTVVTLAALATRGGRVLLAGTIGWTHTVANNSLATIIVRIKDNAVQLSRFDYSTAVPLSGFSLFKYPLPTPQLLYAPAAGSHVYTVTVEVSGGAGNVQTDATNPGTFAAVEFA